MSNYRAHVTVPGTEGFNICLAGPSGYTADTWARHAPDIQPAVKDRLAEDLGLEPGTFGITITINLKEDHHGHLEP